MAEPRCRLWFRGQPLEVPAGSTLGAALWAAGIRTLRSSPRRREPRGMFCAMGVCFECLVRVDGGLERACMLRVREGMEVEPP